MLQGHTQICRRARSGVGLGLGFGFGLGCQALSSCHAPARPHNARISPGPHPDPNLTPFAALSSCHAPAKTHAGFSPGPHPDLNLTLFSIAGSYRTLTLTPFSIAGSCRSARPSSPAPTAPWPRCCASSTLSPDLNPNRIPIPNPSPSPSPDLAPNSNSTPRCCASSTPRPTPRSWPGRAARRRAWQPGGP
eukprot:scaffold21563_cov40-Phaeocystis_antarctica.AAC.1